jgi:hypothetical protein
VELTRVAGGHSGGFAAKLANTGTSSASCTLNDSPNWVAATTAGTYSGSVWVRADAAGASIKVRFREYLNGSLVTAPTTTVTLSTGWQQVTVTDTTSGGSTLDFNIYTSSSPPGGCFYADDVSITRG